MGELLESGSATDGNILTLRRHIHVSLRDRRGQNVFASVDEEGKSQVRQRAKYDDLKYVSQECEWFLGGLLEGLPDGKSFDLLDSCRLISLPVLFLGSDACGEPAIPLI